METRRGTLRTAWYKVKAKLSLTEEDSTPINWKCMSLVFLSLFSSSINISFIFSFLPEMILTFGYKEVEKGYYAGLVASALFVGRIFGSYFWGWMADRHGRRPIVLVTVSLVGLSSLVFGFTTDIYFAVVLRFLSGLVNGTTGLGKTMLYELTDNTNQAVGVSIAGIAWGTGIIVGPAVGGFLSDPSQRFPRTFPDEGFFKQYPYILPSVFAFIACLVTVIVNFIWLPETLNIRKSKEVIITADNNVNLIAKSTESSIINIATALSIKQEQQHLNETHNGRTVSFEQLHLVSENYFNKKIGRSLPDLRENDTELKQISYKCKHYKFRTEVSSEEDLYDNVREKTEETDEIVNDNDDELLQEKLLTTEADTEIGKEVRSNGSNIERNSATQSSGCCTSLKRFSVIRLVSQFDIFLAITLYTVFSFGVIGVKEISTVWASTDIMLDGLGFAPNEIGIVLGATAFPLLFLQLFLFPNLVRRFGIKKTMVICTVLLMVFTECMPCLHLVVHKPVTLWVLLMTNNILMTLMIYCVLSGTSLLVNNSVKPEQAGQVNGLAMTVVAITRSISPIFGGTIFSWNVGYTSDAIGPPLDVSFVFFAFGLVFWMMSIVCVTIPESLNKQKK